MDETLSNECVTCVRCKLKQADFICEACDPYKHFCSNCDGYVHSLPSKREHNRMIINEYSNRRTEHTVKRTLNTTIETNRYTPERVEQDSEGLNSNYIREIRRANEREKEELRSEIDNMRSLLGDKILYLQMQIEENNQRYSNTVKNMDEEFMIKTRNLMAEKDSEIIQLRKNLSDLEIINSDLLMKVNEYKMIVEEQKNSFNSRLTILDHDLKSCETDALELKDHYEERINYLIEQFTQEKAELINDYEINIEKYNDL
jgi:hypothetical protein